MQTGACLGILLMLAAYRITLPQLLTSLGWAGSIPQRGSLAAATLAGLLAAWLVGLVVRRILQRLQGVAGPLITGLVVLAAGGFCLHQAVASVVSLGMLFVLLVIMAAALPALPPPAVWKDPQIRGFTLPEPSQRARCIRGVERWLPIALYLAPTLILILPHPIFLPTFGLPLSLALAWSLGSRVEPRKTQRHSLIWIERGLWFCIAAAPAVTVYLFYGLGLHSKFEERNVCVGILALLAITVMVGILRRNRGYRTRVEPQKLVPLTLLALSLILGAYRVPDSIPSPLLSLWLAEGFAAAVCALWLIAAAGQRWALMAFVLVLTVRPTLIDSATFAHTFPLWLTCLAALSYARSGKLKWLALAGLLAVVSVNFSWAEGLIILAAMGLWSISWHGPLGSQSALQPRSPVKLQVAAVGIGIVAGVLIEAALILFWPGLFPAGEREFFKQIGTGYYFSLPAAIEFRAATWPVIGILAGTAIGAWVTQDIRRAHQRDPRNGMIVLTTCILLFTLISMLMRGAPLASTLAIAAGISLLVLLNARLMQSIESHDETWQPVTRSVLVLALLGLMFLI